MNGRGGFWKQNTNFNQMGRGHFSCIYILLKQFQGIKNVDFSGIQIRIVRVEDEPAYNLATPRPNKT